MLCRLVNLLSHEDCGDELIREAIIALGSFAHGTLTLSFTSISRCLCVCLCVCVSVCVCVCVCVCVRPCGL